jgi:glucokinase
MLEQRFIDAFVNKNLMTANMKKVTVKLVMQEKAGLLGALSVARSSLL